MKWITGFSLRVVIGFAAAIGSAGASAESLSVCHGYSCHYKTPLVLSSGDLRRISSIMSAGKRTAKAERAAVAKVVSYLERRATAVVGVRDLPKSEFGAARQRGQMDCVDESTNTTAVLKLVDRRGLLKHHKVLRTASRGFFADGRYPHFTAVLKDDTGKLWAVDSWYEASGGSPDIMPLSEWKRRGVNGVR